MMKSVCKRRLAIFLIFMVIMIAAFSILNFLVEGILISASFFLGILVGLILIGIVIVVLAQPEKEVPNGSRAG